MPSNPIDMSVKVGGRVFQPHLPVVDGAAPSPLENKFQKTLERYTDENIPIESREGMKTRERVLINLEQICREWIRYECTRKGLPAEVIKEAGGQIFTSGSYRLGVAEPGADIDCILVAPRVVHREDFFGNAHVTDESQARDPQSLAERIRAHPQVTNFVPVEGAAVPILTFDWEGINIDLLFARLNSNSAPKDKMDINNDSILEGVDAATEKSLNGPRVTNLIEAFVRGTPERYQTFLAVVRCVRKWAKARGLYSNKMGYWGGVNVSLFATTMFWQCFVRQTMFVDVIRTKRKFYVCCYYYGTTTDQYCRSAMPAALPQCLSSDTFATVRKKQTKIIIFGC